MLERPVAVVADAVVVQDHDLVSVRRGRVLLARGVRRLDGSLGKKMSRREISFLVNDSTQRASD
jgi:hypothetical protein